MFAPTYAQIQDKTVTGIDFDICYTLTNLLVIHVQIGFELNIKLICTRLA